MLHPEKGRSNFNVVGDGGRLALTTKLAGVGPGEAETEVGNFELAADGCETAVPLSLCSPESRKSRRSPTREMEWGGIEPKEERAVSDSQNSEDTADFNALQDGG